MILIIPFIGYNLQMKRDMVEQHHIVAPLFLLHLAIFHGTFMYCSLQSGLLHLLSTDEIYAQIQASHINCIIDQL